MDFHDVKIVLASSSPSRKMLFETVGVPFEVVVSGVDETVPAHFSPAQTVEVLAKRKAEAVAPACAGKLIIAADSVVVNEGQILGKPENEEKAVEMLLSLSGKIHYVYTGICILHGQRQVLFHQSTAVEFYPLSAKMAWWYVAQGESMGRAGAYGLESKGMLLIKGIRGDYTNVVGIPVAETLRRARKLLDA